MPLEAGPQAALIGGALDLGGSLVGGIISGFRNKRIKGQLEDVNIPGLDEALYKAAYLGDTEALQYFAMENPEIMNFIEDPKLREAQTQALTGLQDIARQGFTPEDRGALEAANMQSAIQARGQREALAQRAQQRGMGGSGLQMAGQLGANQASANRMFTQGAQQGLQALQRKMQAGQAAGQLGGQVRGQEFGMAADKSAAQQRGREMNMANLMNTNQFNIANKMRADLANQGVDMAKIGAQQDLDRMKYEKDLAAASV